MKTDANVNMPLKQLGMSSLKRVSCLGVSGDQYKLLENETGVRDFKVGEPTTTSYIFIEQSDCNCA